LPEQDKPSVLKNAFKSRVLLSVILHASHVLKKSGTRLLATYSKLFLNGKVL